MTQPTEIKCPYCKFKPRYPGDRGDVIVGSLDEQGHYFAILGHNRSIRITGDHFGVYCGKCGNLVYFKDALEAQNLLQVKVMTFGSVVPVGTIGTM